MRTYIRTETGSLYIVWEDAAGIFWLEAKNVPNPCSRIIADSVWEIERPEPWPAIVGKGLWLAAAKRFVMSDPFRMPGGGKRTSYVVSVEH